MAGVAKPILGVKIMPSKAMSMPVNQFVKICFGKTDKSALFDNNVDMVQNGQIHFPSKKF